MRSQHEIDDILQKVRERLAQKQRATGIALTVPNHGYVQDEDWLNVIVAPQANGVRAYQYVDALSELELELRNEGFDKVLLVPALAD